MWWIFGAWIGYQLIGLALALTVVGGVRSRPNAGEWAILIAVWPYLVYSTVAEMRNQNKEKARLKPYEKFLSTLPDEDDNALIRARLRSWTRWWNDDE